MKENQAAALSLAMMMNFIRNFLSGKETEEGKYLKCNNTAYKESITAYHWKLDLF